MKIADLLNETSNPEILESLFLPILMHTSKPIDEFDFKKDTIPLIDKFAARLREKLDHKPSRLYRVATCNPIPYKVIPESIRSRFMTTRIKAEEVSFDTHIYLEELRINFLEALGYQKDNAHEICILTHDVDCEKGLKRALRLKSLEEKHDIGSTWFICTQEYKLDNDVVKRLSENGEVASHGARHIGNLFKIVKEKLVEELRKSRKELEEIVGKEVCGFRAPLLQYNSNLLKAIHEGGFKYDSSMPTWEPVHPLTMKQDGIELLNPIKVNGVLEIPITLTQDHQMLHILGLTPKQTVKQWIKLMNKIQELGGISVLLIHPDYEFANQENLEYYESLLRNVNNVRTLVSVSKFNEVQ